MYGPLQEVTKVMRFNITEPKCGWYNVSPMSASGFAADDGPRYFYISHISDANRFLERYDIKEDKWEILKRDFSPFKPTASISVDKQFLYQVSTNEVDQEDQQVIERFCFKTKDRKEIARFYVPNNGDFSVVIMSNY
jgi:hypothetical protein